MPRKPSILRIETDMLNQTMLLFSPEWQKVQGASKASDEELLMEIGIQDDKEREKVRAKIKAQKEAERKKKEDEERERKREQEILDYSAKVSGGFIEVKIGEDETAMREAWELHINKRYELSDKGVGSAELDKMGLRKYTWEEWKPYYRKMHGLPEDGIKRIPFEGKKKERKIDFNPRKALSTEELSKYGIKMSEDGPVMIPLKQAIEVSNALLTGAKTIYSVRDGLELMK